MALGPSDIAKDLQKKHPALSARQARDMANSVFDSVKKGLARHGKVRTPIGIFTKKVKPAQKGGGKGTNPFTGEEYIKKAKPATATAKFRPNRSFKETLMSRGKK